MSEILKIAQQKVFNIYKHKGSKHLIYHNYAHTVEVVKASKDIAMGLKLSEDDRELLLLAAWFHDTGYVDTYYGHEKISVEYASIFLRENSFNEDKINQVRNCILSTQIPQQPKNEIEEILCDADFAHLGTKDYLEKYQLLWLEKEFIINEPRSSNWLDLEITFLSEHKYFTEYAQRKYEKGKRKNILKLQDLNYEKHQKQVKDVDRKKTQEKRDITPEKGVETLFRVAFRNHMTLSSIADKKANIVLSINAIIITFSLSFLLPRFAENSKLIFPTLILLFFCVGSMIFATISTRPKIADGKFTKEDILNMTPNLIFFGNFHGVPIDEFIWGMEQMMKNKNFLYRTMIKDLYSLGGVLARKYKYLRICYNFFIFGIVVSVAIFIIEFTLN